MRNTKSRIQLGLLAGVGTLVLGLGYQALAEQPTPPPRTVEQRVMELEMRVKYLELKLKTVESVLERTPRLGPQAVQQR
jgi:hypothetical protein